uniref:Myosin light chain alkali n=1 Tax=Timema tahoe TaxID=61484 RepID=A0A7R9IHX1_9NEOP|nr:unnamed protein product [Timema tahoe]
MFSNLFVKYRLPQTSPSDTVSSLRFCSTTRANFAFSIYDFDGSGTVDAIYLGDVLRALNLNPTLAAVEKLGGTKKKNEKKLKVEEFLPIFGQIKKDKDVGCYEDFLECLKLYDKAEDGKMLSAELSHTLLSLGNLSYSSLHKPNTHRLFSELICLDSERLSDKEVDDILKDCLDPEDEDGFVPYAPFLKKVVAGPIFETAE